jgi:hypothetical protein
MRAGPKNEKGKIGSRKDADAFAEKIQTRDTDNMDGHGLDRDTMNGEFQRPDGLKAELQTGAK